MSVYDAVLLVSFGGPEQPEDVLPFLRNVTSGRGVPDDRLAAVAEHYHHFGGRSPINDQNRALLDVLRAELAPRRVYWGNRNWDPFLSDAVAQMQADGVRRAACFVTAAYASYSSCRQYRENLADACATAEAMSSVAPAEAQASPILVLDKLRHYYNHPGFIGAQTDRVREALAELAAVEGDAVAAAAQLVFTAHSIPTASARTSGPAGNAYPEQLAEAARLVAGGVGAGDRWQLAWQSRSGPPQVPWLEPDVGDVLPELAERGVPAVVLVPIGFISDHLEVAYDLDVEAAERAARLGLPLYRAGTVGTHPRFVAMVRELVEERERGSESRPALGRYPASHDICPANCCPPRVWRPAAAGTTSDAIRAVPAREGAEAVGS